jgi:hypothetical protein
LKRRTGGAAEKEREREREREKENKKKDINQYTALD